MMATTSRLRSSLDFDIHIDHNHLSQKASLPSGNKFPVLSDISLNSVQHPNSINIDALTRDLGNLHLAYPSKENNCQQQSHQVQKAKGRKVRMSVDDNIEYDHPFSDKHRAVSGNTTTSASTSASDEFEHHNPLALAKHRLCSNLEQIRKHQEGQFEWLLSIPIPIRKSHRGNRSLSNPRGGADQPQVEKKVLFGCNLIHNRTQSGGSLDHGDKPTNLYTLLATRVEGEEESIMEQSVIVEEADSIIANTSHEESSAMLRGGDENLQPDVQDVSHGRPKSVLSIKVDEPLMSMDHLSPLPSPQPARPLSRIEDSVEELDKLEEELEALDEVAQLKRVVSPEFAPEPVLESIPETTIQRQAPPAARRTSTVRALTTTTHTTTRTRSTAEHSSSVRKSASASSGRNDDKPATSKTTVNTSTARRSIARPSSLLPPKATVKSSRAPTVAAFELPGDAVARRLKEQRAARLSQQVSAEEAAAIAAQFSPSKPHVKSTKPVTKSTFELPGEAISRRKREEREARLKVQEEEERKRREFKARPIRTSVIGSGGCSAVRETATSRARQARMEAAAANGGQATTPTHGHVSSATAPTSASAARKRHSIAAAGGGYASSTVAASTRSVVSQTTTRGRTSLAAPSGVGSSSRGTSATSAASSNGKRSSTTTVSQEEVQQQKLRGKEIFKRDNSYTSERERERKEREQAAKMARQEAAERSRALGREWKEKMAVRQKRVSLVVSGSGLQG
ncbi:hypothetical protein QBC36DRAFT_298009 [Triangularia setosa]|uniref:Carboxylesterase family protein n=1 Tax=Triangularia setosa TaxID=2587417 RepID=A0AAN6WDV1_9PEZI|nr:hypothetical protein QBC36DRAFT_298009 [Podospora setosa]